MENYSGQQALVLGLGESGLAASHYLVRRGARVLGLDKNPGKILESLQGAALEKKGVVIKSDGEQVDLKNIQFVVLSPGVSPSHTICQQALALGIPILGEIELGCKEIKQKAIGVTGTNGKTTVSLLIAHILQTAGIPARVVGNIDKYYGLPLTAALETPFEGAYVIELSSYQLETLRNPVLDVGVILNITPDHLDRYKTMQAYAQAKIGMQYCVKTNGSFWVEDACYREWPALFTFRRPQTFGFYAENDVTYSEKIEYFLPEEYRGRRDHHIVNIMAAFVATRAFGITEEKFARALTSFSRPSHRIEFVRSWRGVRFYNDSKGTNLDAVVKAVQSIEAPICLLAGGVDKGAPYTPWIEQFEGKVEKIYAIGQAAEKIHQQLNQVIPIVVCRSLEEAIVEASSATHAGASVLLSPGCASYDMFKDYAHRGDEFKRVVNSLPE